ncbi:MAG: DUF4440 domain-containing protein [Gammaproteobacteria bacterium]
MNVVDEMLACEQQLLHDGFRNDVAGLEKLLTSDFVEISHGRISDRAQVIAWLLNKDPAARWTFSDVHVTELARDVRLVRYHAKQVQPQPSQGNGALHSSIWCFHGGLACWQLRFHQVTRLR